MKHLCKILQKNLWLRHPRQPPTRHLHLPLQQIQPSHRPAHPPTSLLQLPELTPLMTPSHSLPEKGNESQALWSITMTAPTNPSFRIRPTATLSCGSPPDFLHHHQPGLTLHSIGIAPCSPTKLLAVCGILSNFAIRKTNSLKIHLPSPAIRYEHFNQQPLGRIQRKISL